MHNQDKVKRSDKIGGGHVTTPHFLRTIGSDQMNKMEVNTNIKLKQNQSMCIQGDRIKNKRHQSVCSKCQTTNQVYRALPLYQVGDLQVGRKSNYVEKDPPFG